jgi:hypothetical protein
MPCVLSVQCCPFRLKLIRREINVEVKNGAGILVCMARTDPLCSDLRGVSE